MPDDIKTKVANFFTQYPLRTFDKQETVIHAEAELNGVTRLFSV